MNLDTPIQYLKGVGPKSAQKLKKLGLEKISDVIYNYPRDWLNLNNISQISNLRIGEEVVIKGEITEINSGRTFKKRMSLIRAKIADRSGEIILVWFNQPFLMTTLKKGSTYYFYGRIDYDFLLKQKTMQPAGFEKVSGILPIYSETKGITSRYLRKISKAVLNELPHDIIEYLPQKVLEGKELVDLKNALKEIHFPYNSNHLQKEKKRLAFDEIFIICLKTLIVKKSVFSQTAPKIRINSTILKEFTTQLPYKLTSSQRKSSWEIIQDLSKNRSMNRLLIGDVGSGKTVVAVLAALATIKSGHQVVWMAPTEILANQHFETAKKFLNNFNVTVSLVTSNRVTNNKSDQISESNPPAGLQLRGSDSRSGLISNKTKNSNVQNSKKPCLPAGRLKSYVTNDLIANSQLIIGTHALIQDKISFPNLGLVIIDEQHRFGVQQRSALQRGTTLNETRNHAENYLRQSASSPRQSANVVPHFLSMTATPIPRTMALTFYGDLDISTINEMPSGKAKTTTKFVDPTNRQKAYDFIKNQIKLGRQAFVICPLIETKNDPPAGLQLRDSDSRSGLKTKKLFDLERKSVKAEYDKLSKKIFPNLKIRILHGKMKSQEKEQIMEDFRKNKFNILVSTSIIEVGIDIPNATVMLIEDAERFGLSQLHQFRGRVGRGKHSSYCFIFSSSLSEESRRRLNILEECNDGFHLAEKDLSLRGPGELLGASQHGFPDLKIASITDTILVKKASNCAKIIVEEGIEKYPLLVKKIQNSSINYHLE